MLGALRANSGYRACDAQNQAVRQGHSPEGAAIRVDDVGYCAGTVRFSDAGGVRKTPRQEIARGGASRVQRVLWRFNSLTVDLLMRWWTVCADFARALKT